MQRGFIQIPFLIAIIIVAVLGGGAYVAYEVAKPSQKVSDLTTLATTTVANVQTTTTADSDAEIKELKEEIASLKKSVSKSKVVTETVVNESVPISVPKQNVTEEDSLIKVERCRNASDIASDERRLRNAIGIELLNCRSQSNCSYENTKSFLDTLLRNSKASTYKSTYDWCLTSSKSDFESGNLIIENYWQQCETAHPGSLGLSLYNERQECVTSLVVTRGI